MFSSLTCLSKVLAITFSPRRLKQFIYLCKNAGSERR